MNLKQSLGLLLFVGGIGLILLGQHYMYEIENAHKFVDSMSKMFTGWYGVLFSKAGHQEVSKYTPKVKACMYSGSIMAFCGLLLLIFGGSRKNIKTGRGDKGE